MTTMRVIQKLVPGAVCTVDERAGAIVEWQDARPQPTPAEIEAMRPTVEAEIEQERQAAATAQQRRDRIRSDIGDRSEQIDLASAAAIRAMARDLMAVLDALGLTAEHMAAVPQRYRRVLQRLETIALDETLWPGDET